MSDLLSIGSSALRANQRALATTSHNIANVNTPGFSRQRVDFRAQQIEGSLVGAGVNSDQVSRISDRFAVGRLNDSTSEHAALSAGADLASRLDATLSDASAGLAQPLREFLDGLDALAADPASVEQRTVVLGRAQSLGDRFDAQQDNITSMRAEINQQVDNAVSEINGLASSIAKLNDQIAESQAVLGSSEPNDLLDRRDHLVNELSQRIDVSTVELGDGSVNVSVGNGVSLVVGNQAQTLSSVAGSNPMQTNDVRVGSASVGGQISGGLLGGVLRFSREVLDPAQNDLTALASGLADTVNTAQANGTDLDGNPGQALFQVSPPSAALNLLQTDPNSLAAAGAGQPANSGDNSNLLAMTDALRGAVVNGQSVQAANATMVARVGTQARQLNAAETAQLAVVNHHQNLRDEVSAVNLDEEAANLLRYQQAFQAAARVITVADEMIQTLLNAT